MDSRRERKSFVPPWVRYLDVPVWICGPNGDINHLNERAAALLGRSIAECVGRKCYSIVGAVDASGAPYCRPSCAITRLSRAGRPIKPVEMGIDGPGHRRRWIQLLPIPVTAADRSGPWLVHCALPADRAHRIADYLTKVASRGPPAEFAIGTPGHSELTKRENEVLHLLAEGEDLHAIAEKLYVSYTTVRNHVQHILAKLGAHSILEAVARRLLLSK